MAQELLDYQPSCDSTSRQNAQHADCAEEVQRAREVAEQETDGEQIEEDAEGTRNAIMRNSPCAIDVGDGDFTDRRAVPRCQCRNEAVQLSVERNLLQDFAAVGFE